MLVNVTMNFTTSKNTKNKP